MKKVPKGYYVVSGLLLFWAANDFYHYIGIGKGLIAHYSGKSIIQELVQKSLVQGVIKALLGCLVITIGLQRSKESKPTRSLTAVTRLLILSVGLTWLTSMACLTVVTAQEIYERLYSESYDFAEYVDRCGGLSDFYDSRYKVQYKRPDFLEYNMLYSICGNTGHAVRSSGNYDRDDNRSKLIREVNYPMETAVLFYDGEGSLLHSSEEDIMFFSYYTQEEWDAGDDTTGGLHYGWINISEGKNAENWRDDPYLRFRSAYSNVHNLMEFCALRVTGVFDGCELKPVSMYYVTDTQIRQVLEDTDQFSTDSGYSYYISALDRTGALEWQLQFDHSAEYTGSSLVTVYIEHPDMWDHEGMPLIYGGEEYESLTALAKVLDLPSRQKSYPHHDSLWNVDRFDLNELLVFSVRQYADFAGFDYEAGGEPPVELTMVTAIRSHPLSCAAGALRNVYIATGLLALVLLLAIRGSIKKYLVTPLAEINRGIASGWGSLDYLRETPQRWAEPWELVRHYTDTQGALRINKNEITRLRTALDYAKSAEQNRRQMTSNIAHELKTPLAVVHSYAEGLKEHIAEEKRDKYLEVILSETERMDHIVLEMLDLSRLESGKVKLSSDEFSFPTLTRSIFEKLEIAARAKELQIDYSFPEDFSAVADESRIAQVIENLAINAIKYTPAGGHILVKIRKRQAKISFAIENECEPLSEEALSKVWDTFYRTDESRSGGGTGLGLSIAKNIIELHGGECSVRNTKIGVEFSFTI